MVTAIIIVVMLGIFDTVVFLACVELEKYREIEDERSDRKADK